MRVVRTEGRGESPPLVPYGVYVRVGLVLYATTDVDTDTVMRKELFHLPLPLREEKLHKSLTDTVD